MDKAGIISPEKVIEALRVEIEQPSIPDWIAKWIEAENNRPWPPNKE